MSLRPLTDIEKEKANGSPWSTLSGIFFGMQGMLSYMAANQVSHPIHILETLSVWDGYTIQKNHFSV
jgi:hypothetical protein